jgi:hypothetical protein
MTTGEAITLAVLVMVGGAALMIAIVWITVKVTHYGLRNSSPYDEAVAAVKHSTEARQVLGTPLQFGDPAGAIAGGLPTLATLSIPVSGSRASGVVYVTGRRVFLKWKYPRLELDVNGARTIQLRGRVVCQ